MIEWTQSRINFLNHEQKPVTTSTVSGFFLFYWFYKTFNYMAHKLIFTDVDDDVTAEVFTMQNSNIVVLLNCFGHETHIELDIPTAIKFAKTLRTEINKAKEASNE